MRDRGAVDLATGHFVLLRIRDAGSVAEQTQWTVRCGTLQKLRHGALARLVDHGVLGRTQRFEAWRCGSPWAGDATAADKQRRAVSAFLRACGLSNGHGSLGDMYAHEGRPVLVPSDAVRLGDNLPEVTAVTLDELGWIAIDRPGCQAAAEIFESRDYRPGVLGLWGPSGCGKTHAVEDLAQAARARGFVPLAARVVTAKVLEAVSGRSVFVIDDHPRDAGWPALLRVALHSARAHVLLSTSIEEPSGVAGVRLAPVPFDVLVASVRPTLMDPALQRRSLHAARESHGNPGRFVELLWGSGTSQRTAARPAHRGSRAAEQPAIYGEEALALEEPPTAARRVWPALEELTALRRRAADAVGLVKRGRYGPGVRQLRQGIGALVRRADWAHGASGAMALAEALSTRGQFREAIDVLRHAREYATRAGNDRALIDIAIQSGHARIDLGRLDEAESVIGAAVEAARDHGTPEQAALAALALARCLFWQGRYAEQGAAVSSVEGAPPADVLVSSHIEKALAAVGVRDLPRAMSFVSDAAEQAISSGDARLAARAMEAAAFVRLAVDDISGVEAAVARVIAFARAAHAPIQALSARLLWAEAQRRRGRQARALAVAARVRRIGATRLPLLLRARADLLTDLLTASAAPHAVAQKHAAATGLASLALYAPAPPRNGVATTLSDSFDEVIGIVNLCQTAEDEAHVLREVCAKTRRQLRARAVAVVSGLSRVLAADGPPVESALVGRAMASGLDIAPERCDDHVEAGAVVRYGGSGIGVVIARWPLGVPGDLSAAWSALRVTAAAVGPIVAAALARGASRVAPEMGDLLGVSVPMRELRGAIERAALAPFSILVEGESGSGKELVARAVHRLGPRRDRPFRTLNCAALPDELIEAELFGHARGAFTGAVGERPGVFEDAHGGTLLLDEVGELSPRAQAKVLRVIQEGELRRLGENMARRVDVRIVAATNRDLRHEVTAGRFRLDLLYRLDVVRIVVPPLRERAEDVAVLAEHFWREAADRVGSRATLGASALAALARYHWPGNVRELQNVLAALAVRSPRRGVVPATALPVAGGQPTGREVHRLDAARRAFEERFVRAALARAGGRRTQTAVELGVTRQGLTKLMTRLGIQ